MKKLIRNEDITTSGFVETVLEVLNAPMGVIKVENTLMNLNRVQLLIRDKVITTSGLAETIFRVINTTIGVTIVEKMIRI